MLTLPPAVRTLARNKADEPGLVPTRVHGLFRGLHGLYAWVNPHCGGRQSKPGEQAILGKLFTTPRAVCDACGCRVFEIASCRSCGSPYLLAYSQDESLDRLSFLWGETEGALSRPSCAMPPRTPWPRRERPCGEASGEKPAAPRSPRLLEPDLTHCGVALVEQAVGQHFLVIVLAEAAR